MPRLRQAARAEAAGAAGGFRQGLRFGELHLGQLGDHRAGRCGRRARSRTAPCGRCSAAAPAPRRGSPASIRPGAFTSAMPWRAARPERGSTRPAWPSGIATAIPVPTLARSPGPIVAASAARRSQPASCSCARSGARAASAEALELDDQAGSWPLRSYGRRRSATAAGTRACTRTPARRCPRAPGRRPARAAPTGTARARTAPAAPSRSSAGAGTSASMRRAQLLQALARESRRPARRRGCRSGELAAALVGPAGRSCSARAAVASRRRRSRRAPRRPRASHLVQLLLRHGGIGHVHDQVRVQRLLERRLERLHQLVRQLADEADGVGQQVVAALDAERARGRVERVEQPCPARPRPRR